MFNVKTDRPQWQAVYERLKDMRIGEVITDVKRCHRPIAGDRCRTKSSNGAELEPLIQPPPKSWRSSAAGCGARY